MTPDSYSLADAYDKFMEGAYDEALSMYEAISRLVKEPVKSDEAKLGLARCHVQLGSYGKANEVLRTIKKRESSAWHSMVAEVLERTGEYEEALTHARTAVKSAKGSAGPRLRVGRLLETLGRRADAIEAYHWFDRQLVQREELPNDARWMTDAALGFVRYSVLTRTNLADRVRHALTNMLQPAYERVDRSYWPARIAAADLLRERFNNDEDDGSLSDYEAALRINGKLPQAHVGIGEVMLLAWNFEEVERRAELALEVNPFYAPAIHLLGKKLLAERRYGHAYETAERALDTNPNDLTALAICAAAKACQFDQLAVEKFAKKAKSISARPAVFHRILGDALGGIRQYQDSERAYLKAIEYDPTDANARTELGMMYMQWGLEQKARNVLEAAFVLDPFNERTEFTLELFDSLSKFDRVETPHFVVKYDAHRDPGLGDLVAEYMEDIYDSVTGDYDTPIDGKTIIEFFPTHRAFGVRITGKPWIHTVGAATGRVIALASPRDSAHVTPYNLARVLKHEFTHTVTLEATRNRIPHWFTEGLAVLQEDAPRSFHWAVALAEALRRDRLFTLESIDWGFMRPRQRGDRQLAYAQSEWMCEFLVERFGYDSINKMLRLYYRGKAQPEVFDTILDTSTTDFHRDFLTWARGQVRDWGFDLAPPDDLEQLRKEAAENDEDAMLHGRLAQAELDAGHRDRAMEAAQRALELDKNDSSSLTAFVTILASLVQEEPDRSTRQMYDENAIPLLERLLVVDPDGWIAPRFRAEIALRRRDYDRATRLFKRLQSVCPMDPASWQGLAGIYLVQDKPDLALPQLLELVRLTPDDADSYAQIAQIYRRNSRLGEAQYWFRQALYVSPFSIEYHKMLGDTHMQAGATSAAMAEYRTLTLIDPQTVLHFELAAAAAHKAGDVEKAREFATRAVAMDPSSPVRSLLP